MAGLAGWRWLRVVAWSLAGLTALVLVAALVLLGLDVPVLDAGRVAVYVVSALAVAVSAGIGCLIATRLPANAIGWLLSVIGLSLAVSMFGELYALWGLAVAAGSLPGAGLACACRKPRPRQATRRYSLIVPPARVCLRTRYCSRSTGPGSGFSGAASCRER
jgi:hypothetical protein